MLFHASCFGTGSTLTPIWSLTKEFKDYFVLILKQIIDAVVAAYILNATLIVPVLDQKSYWKDVR